MFYDIPYVGKFWSGKKLANSANRRPFANLPMFLFMISFGYTCSSFARQYFTLQLIQFSTFANVLSRQNFPTYGIANYHLVDTCAAF